MAVLVTGGFEFITNNSINYRLALPDSMATSVFALNALAVLVVLSLLYSATNRWLLSALTVVLVAVLLLGVNVAKLTALGRPFLPSDVFLADEIVLLFPTLYASFKGTFFLALSTSVIGSLALYWSRSKLRLKMSPVPRLIVGGLSIFCISLAIGVSMAYPKAKNSLLATITFDQKLSYEKNGFVLSSLFQLSNLRRVAAPEGYSKERIEEIFARPFFANEQSTSRANDSPAGSQEPANVILILLEAFWDPTLLPVEFTRDPIPFFHRLQVEGATRTIVIPTFGGETVRTEFEVLTGLPVSSLPKTANPYSRFVRRPIAALPAIFEANGYHTAAIHPYYGGYWDRATVFPLMGFQRYLDVEDFENPIRSGPRLISDESFVQKIIEYSQINDDKPLFLYAISIATHGPFSYQGFADSDLDVQSPLTSESKQILKTYSNAVSLADEAFERLTEHFAGLPQKTLIVAFGDHLPILGDNFRVYRETGYMRAGESSDSKMYSAPLMIWANYDLKESGSKAEEPIPSHLLLSHIASMAGIESTRVTLFNEYARKGFMRSSHEISADYEQITYDMLFGEQYMLGDESYASMNAEMRRDYFAHVAQKTNIKRQAPSVLNWGPKKTLAGIPFNLQPDGSSAFWFKTRNASKYTHAELDGETLVTTYNPDTGSMSAKVPEGFIEEPGQYPLRLFDRRSKLSSKEVVLTVYEDLPVADIKKPEDSAGSGFPDYIAHAGGLINGRAYTNSLEALNHNYTRGFRFFELDISWTTDRKLVLIHDWKGTLTNSFGVGEGQLSLNAFSALIDRDGLTQMTIPQLAQWVSEHPDVSIVTDIKEDNISALKQIAQHYPQLAEHLVVQIYNNEEYEPVRQLGFDRIILTLYRSGYGDEEVLRSAASRTHVPVTMPVYRADAGLARKLKEFNVFVYVHTVNEPCAEVKLRNMGVDGFYTDKLNPKGADSNNRAISDSLCGKSDEAVAERAGAPIIKDYGPKSTVAGKGFNIQANGEAAMWLHLLNASTSTVIEIGDHALVPNTVTQDGEVTKITTFVPLHLYVQTGTYEIRVLDQASGTRSEKVLLSITEE